MSKLVKEGHNGHFGICFKSQEDKIINSFCLLQLKEEKNVNGKRGGPVAKMAFC